MMAASSMALCALHALGANFIMSSRFSMRSFWCSSCALALLFAFSQASGSSRLDFGGGIQVIPRVVGLRDLLAGTLLHPAKLGLKQRALGPVDLLRGRHLRQVVLRSLRHPSYLLLHQLVGRLAPTLGEDVRVGQGVDERVVPPRGLLLRAIQQHGFGAHVGRSLRFARVRGALRVGRLARKNGALGACASERPRRPNASTTRYFIHHLSTRLPAW